MVMNADGLDPKYVVGWLIKRGHIRLSAIPILEPANQTSGKRWRSVVSPYFDAIRETYELYKSVGCHLFPQSTDTQNRSPVTSTLSTIFKGDSVPP